MKNGLKGVTDATVFCKSMKKGGEKNQMIRSMKSYELGGVTGLQSPDAVSEESNCTYVMEGYPPKKKKKCRGNHQSTRSYTRSRRVPGLNN